MLTTNQLQHIIRRIAGLPTAGLTSQTLDTKKEDDITRPPGIIQIKARINEQKNLIIDALISESCFFESQIELSILSEALSGIQTFQILHKTGNSRFECWIRLLIPGGMEAAFAGRYAIRQITAVQNAAKTIQLNLKKSSSPDNNQDLIYLGHPHINSIYRFGPSFMKRCEKLSILNVVREMIEWRIIADDNVAIHISGKLSRGFFMSLLATTLGEYHRTAGQLTTIPQVWEILHVPDILYIPMDEFHSSEKTVLPILKSLKSTWVITFSKETPVPDLTCFTYRIPDQSIPPEFLIDYAIQVSSQRLGNLSKASREKVQKHILQTIDKFGRISEKDLYALIQRNLHHEMHHIPLKMKKDLQYLFSK